MFEHCLMNDGAATVWIIRYDACTTTANCEEKHRVSAIKSYFDALIDAKKEFSKVFLV